MTRAPRSKGPNHSWTRPPITSSSISGLPSTSAIGTNPSKASQHAEALDAQLWRLEASQPEKTDHSSMTGPNENLPPILNLLGKMSLDLRGNLESARGNMTEAINLLEQAAEKDKEARLFRAASLLPPPARKVFATPT